MALTEEELEQIRLSRGTSETQLSAGQAAPHAYAVNQLTGAQALGEIGGFDTTNLEQYRKQQEQALLGYQPKIRSLFEAKNISEGMDWWSDQAMLNSMNQIVPMLGYVTGGILQAIPNPVAKFFGKAITGATFGTQYNANLGDTLQEHEERAGRPLSTQEKMWAGSVSGLVTALDYLVPGKVSKDVVKSMGGMKNVVKTRETLMKQLKETRQSLGKSLATGSKYAGGVAGKEFTTEAAQKALQIGTSVDPGYLGTTEGMQSVVQEGLAAGPTSAIISSPQAMMEGGAHNRAINRARQQADVFNKELLQADADIFEKTGVDPKKFDELEITDIPERGGLSGAIAKKSKEWGLNEIGETFGDVGVFKAPMQIKRARDRATSGEAYSRLNKILQRFLPTGSFSGETQKILNFDTVKGVVHGELLSGVTEVLNKYSNKKFASLGSPVIDPKLNTHIRDVMRGKVNKHSRPDLITNKDMDVILTARDRAGELLKETTGSGIVENYINNPVSVESVKGNKQGFVDSLIESSKKAYYASTKKASEKTHFIYQPNDDLGNRERADVIAEDVIQGRDPNIVTSKFIKDQYKKEKEGKGKESFEKSRSKEWENLSDDFREQDISKVLEGYLSKTATRVASAQTFGAKNADVLQKDLDALAESGDITQEEVDRVWDLYDASHNIYRRDVGKAETNLRKVSKIATQVTAITHLGMATLSSLAELAWVGERAGFGNMLRTLPSALNYTRKGARKGLGGKPMTESEGWKTLANLGLNLNPHVNDRLDQMFATDKSSVLNAYFRSPFGMFLTQWTNFNRNWAAQAGMMSMNRRAKGLVNGTIDPMDERRLRNELSENGITLDEFKQLAALSKDQDGNININIIDDNYLNKDLIKDDGTKTRVRDILVPWVHKIVDDVVVHPKAHNKPLWMSDPSFAMIAQLKTFPIVFGNTVVKRLMRKLNPKNCSTDFGLAMSVVGGIAAAYALATLGDEMKSAIRQQDPKDKSWVDMGNITGLTGAFGLIAGGAKYGDLTTSLLGPSYDAINTAATEVLNPFLEGEPMESGTNLVEWFGGAVDSSLGAAGIYFTPFGEDK
jgi:hypothetical protein